METKFFIGRERELEVLQSELSESDQFKDPSRIFYLRGTEGIGKRTLITQLFKHLKNSPLEVISVRPLAWSQLERESEWMNLFTASMEANHPGLTSRVEAFKQSWAESPKPAMAGGASTYEDSRVQQWLDMLARYVLGRESIHSASKIKNLRLVFVLDNYNSLSASRKQWFSSGIFSKLITVIPDLDVRFILSGEQSFYETLDLESFWVPFQTEVRELDVPPFSPDETREFARRAKVLVSEHIDLHEMTSGVPQRIKELLMSGKVLAEDLHRVNEVEGIFRALDEESRNWILGAVHLRVFDDEALNIFGTHAGSRRAYKWLRNQEHIKVEKVPNGYRCDPTWSDAILRWQEQFNPEQYRKLASRVQTFQEICEHIPEREHREKLARLSVSNFFNEELIHKIYGDDGNSLNAFVRMYLKYFIKTPFNYQISMQYVPFVQNYVRLIPMEDKEHLKEKVSYLWEKKREAIAHEAEDIESKLAKERRSFDENRVKLDPIMRQIHQRSRGLIRKARKEERRKNSLGSAAKKIMSSGKQPKVLCLFFNVIGLFLLYYGLLFKAYSDWNYITLGILFVVLGIFWPALQEEEPPRAASGGRASRSSKNEDPTAGDTLINLLNIKRVGLENRASYLSMQVARYQRRLRELDTLLSEPYTF